MYSKGKVFYNPNYSVTRKSDGASIPAPTFLMSFSSITEDAAARNHTFLELLKSNFRNHEIDAAATPIISYPAETLENQVSLSNLDSRLTSSFTRPASEVSTLPEDSSGG